MEDAKRARHSDAINLIAGIRNKEGYQINLGQHTPLINNLEIRIIFKNKAKEEGVGVIDLIYRTVQVLKKNLYWIRISSQDTGLIEPIELWDEGQLSYITSYGLYTEQTYVLMYLYTKRTYVPTYWTITIGRSYVFKYTVLTIRQFSSSQ